MHTVTLWRARTTKAAKAVIVVQFTYAFKLLSCATRHIMLIRRDIQCYPVPPTTASRCIGVISGNGKTFGAFRGIVPAQLWRQIITATTKTIKHKMLRHS
ncbi:Uncharacterised protein [Vibrio cholerae]|nr:Uncharacterised protein [Vibrio cholerae]